MADSNDLLNPDDVTTNHVHWSSTRLLEVPPVLLVTEYEPVRIREDLATFLDGRHVNDALSQAVTAIRKEYELEPHAYVVVFPHEALEIPIDLRRDLGRLVAPCRASSRSLAVPQKSCSSTPSFAGPSRTQLVSVSREEAINGLKQLSSDGQEFLLSDRCCGDERFAHQFNDGRYHHNYRYVAAELPG